MQACIEIDTIARRAAEYRNSGEHNDWLYQEFTLAAKSLPWLRLHKEHIIRHELGYGEFAHHYLWYLLVQHIGGMSRRPRMLEIGVYKGQVISLWSLIARETRLNPDITAISPLKGNPMPRARWSRAWKRLTSEAYRKDRGAGNFYDHACYRDVITELFSTFELDFAAIRLIEGYSNDPDVLAGLADDRFDLVYVFGDHTYEVATQDIRNFGSRIVPGGFLVMDDASCFIPGSAYWKGHETVSRACEIIPSLGFTNVINVGHNRVFQKARD